MCPEDAVLVGATPAAAFVVEQELGLAASKSGTVVVGCMVSCSVRWFCGCGLVSGTAREGGKPFIKKDAGGEKRHTMTARAESQRPRTRWRSVQADGAMPDGLVPEDPKRHLARVLARVAVGSPEARCGCWVKVKKERSGEKKGHGRDEGFEGQPWPWPCQRRRHGTYCLLRLSEIDR